MPRLLYSLTIALWLAWSAPTWWARSMFMDGLWYATLARNLAVGIGTPFAPQLTETLGQSFTAHPPLMVWLESLLFGGLGDHWWVERLFSGGLIVLAGGLLWGSWRQLRPDDGAQTGWLPLLLWVSMPLLPWATGAHMLENLLLVCFGGLLYAWLRFAHGHGWSWLLLAGVAFGAAIWTKGPAALFMGSLPFWAGLTVPAVGWRRGLRDSLGLTGIAAALTGLLLLWPPAWTFAQGYWDTLLRGTLAVAVVSSRWYILGKWLMELLPPLLLSGGLAWALRRYLRPLPGRGWPLAFLLTGLSGVLPYLLVLKQRGFYLLPALPCFALALALLLAPAWWAWYQRQDWSPRWQRGFRLAAMGLGAVALAVLLASVGRVGKHADRLALAEQLARRLPAGTVIGTCAAQWQDWSLHGYLYRQGYLSLSRREEAGEWWLQGPLCSPGTGEPTLTVGPFALWPEAPTRAK